MRPSTKDILVYAFTSTAISVGLVGIVISIWRSHLVPDPDSPQGFDEFLQHHLTARGWLVIVSCAAVALAFYATSKETPLWVLRQSAKTGHARHEVSAARKKEVRKIRTRRSAAVISTGLGVALISLGMAAILLHQAYTMHEGVRGYDGYFDEWIGEANLSTIVGLVGAGILAFGLLFSRARDPEFEEPMVYGRPIWHGLLVMALGASIIAAFWYYGSVKYDEYYDRDDTGTLSLLMMGGFLLAFLVFIAGLFMWARNTPLIKNPYTLLSGGQEEDRE